MGDGSTESLRAMVNKGMEDYKAGRVYTTEQLLERFRAKKANPSNKSTNQPITNNPQQK